MSEQYVNPEARGWGIPEFAEDRTPEQPQGDVKETDTIERMIRAFDGAKDQDYNGSPSERYWCMTAAAKVLLDEALGSAEPNETEAWSKKYAIPELAVVQIISAYQESRRARIHDIVEPFDAVQPQILFRFGDERAVAGRLGTRQRGFQSWRLLR